MLITMTHQSLVLEDVVAALTSELLHLLLPIEQSLIEDFKLKSSLSHSSCRDMYPIHRRGINYLVVDVLELEFVFQQSFIQSLLKPN